VVVLQPFDQAAVLYMPMAQKKVEVVDACWHGVVVLHRGLSWVTRPLMGCGVWDYCVGQRKSSGENGLQ
jgi:hypothetical protein